jgi:hypothetical protein
MKLVNVKRLLPFTMEQPVTPSNGTKTYVYIYSISFNPQAPKLTLEALQKYVEGLKERMKAKHGEEVANLFYVGRKTFEGKSYVFLGRKRKGAKGFKASDRLPIYFEALPDGSLGEAYVPESYTRKGLKRAQFLLMTVLGALQQTVKQRVK